MRKLPAAGVEVPTTEIQSSDLNKQEQRRRWISFRKTLRGKPRGCTVKFLNDEGNQSNLADLRRCWFSFLRPPALLGRVGAFWEDVRRKVAWSHLLSRNICKTTLRRESVYYDSYACFHTF